MSDATPISTASELMEDAEEPIDVLYFRQPTGKQVLFVWGIDEHLTWEQKWDELEKAFREFGLLHSVVVPIESVCYAFIKYFSSEAASRALDSTNRKLVIGNSVIQVSFSNVTTKVLWPLHISHCHKLANHYLTYNGWNIRIMSLDDSGHEYQCTVHLEVRECKINVTGGGCSRLNLAGEDDQFIHDTGNIIKSAYHRACENAFSKIALAIFKQRKPFVFVVKQDDHYLNSVQSYVDSVLLHPK